MAIGRCLGVGAVPPAVEDLQARGSDHADAFVPGDPGGTTRAVGGRLGGIGAVCYQPIPLTRAAEPNTPLTQKVGIRAVGQSMRIMGNAEAAPRAWEAPSNRLPRLPIELSGCGHRPLLSVGDRWGPMLRARPGHGRRGSTRLGLVVMVTSLGDG